MQSCVFLFILDSVRPDRLPSCAPGAPRRTFIDELIEQGAVSTHCFAAGPYTLIALNAMFTGLYGSTNGVNGYYLNTPDDLAADAVTLTDLVRQAGYATSYHCEYPDRGCMPPHSFDVYRIGGQWDEARLMETLRAQSRPRFAVIHLEHVHDVATQQAATCTPDVYDAAVARVAEQLRRLHAELVREGDLVVLTSDHGVRIREPGDEALSPPDRHYREPSTGVHLTDRTTRTFFALIQEGVVPAGRRVDRVTRAIDIAPTLCDALGLGRLGGQGASLWPAVRGEAEPPALTAFMETGGAKMSPWRPDVRAVRVDGWKFVRHDAFGESLFHLDGSADAEARNLIGQGLPQEPELRAALERQLMDAARGVGWCYGAAGLDHAAVLAARPPTPAVPNTFAAKLAATGRSVAGGPGVWARLRRSLHKRLNRLRGAR